MSNIEVARQLIAAMHSDPEVAGEVRRAVLTDDLLGLPDQFRQLTEQVREQGEQLRQLTEQVREQGEQLRQLTEQVREQGEQLRQLTEDVRQLTAAQMRTNADVSDLKGMRLETNVASDPRRYIPRRLATHVKRMDDERFAELLDALDDEVADEVQLADALLEAEHPGTHERVVLVVEASWTAHVDDVERAERRARHLRDSGVSALGVVISRVDPDPLVLATARRLSVAVVSESKGLLVPDRPSAA